MTTGARWWVMGSDNRPWGPFETEAVHAYLREGRVKARDLICPEGGTTWQAANTVAEFMPTTGTDPSAIAPPLSPDDLPATLDVRELRRGDCAHVLPVGALLLSFFSLGIYGYVAFYQLALRYRRLAGIKASYFETLFCIYITLVVTSSAVHVLGRAAPLVGLERLNHVLTVLGLVLLHNAVIVLGVLLLNHVLSLRQHAWSRVAPGEQASPAFRSFGWHATLFLAPSVLSVVAVIWFAARASNIGSVAALDILLSHPERLWRTLLLVIAGGSVPAAVQAARVFIEWNAVAVVLFERACAAEA